MSISPDQAARIGEQCVAQLKIANELAMAGDMEAAIEHFQGRPGINPRNHLVHDDLVYLLHFHPGYDDQDISRELAIWEQQHARPLADSILPNQNNRDPGRRLKIGYVTRNYCRQAESFFVLPLLQSHDHRQFEVHCYSSVAKPDDRTEQTKKCADVWHNVLPLNDAELAERIRGDQIDILIDLTMHMRLSRMPTFALKPAPVQVTWLAYPGGTGLRTMDYRLTDRYFDPPGMPGLHTEEACRLPDCWVCYNPLAQSALATPRTKGPICFGSLNHPRKINDSNLRLWAKILPAHRRLPDYSASGRRPAPATRVEDFPGQGESHPIASNSWVCNHDGNTFGPTIGSISPWIRCLTTEYTTTCDAFWMGTPVVSLIGKTTTGRAGLGILSTIGLPELAANDPDQFVEIAVGLAGSRPADRLAKKFRRRMESSPLMDAARFARNVESAYRWMWQRWCTKPDPISTEPIPAAALEHHSARRWPRPRRFIAKYWSGSPGIRTALNLLGLVAGQTGRATLAVETISRTIAADPTVAAYHCNLGVILQNMGKVDEAIAAYRRAISVEPGFAEAYNNLGNSLRLKGDLEHAVKAFRRAIELKPEFAEAHGNLGGMLKEKGDLDGAIIALRRAAELNPRMAAILTNLRSALSDKELSDEAIASCRRTIEVDPQCAGLQQSRLCSDEKGGNR